MHLPLANFIFIELIVSMLTKIIQCSKQVGFTNPKKLSKAKLCVIIYKK